MITPKRVNGGGGMTFGRVDMAGRGEPASPAPRDGRINWLDMVTVIDNEQGRHVIGAKLARAELAEGKLTGVALETAQRVLAERERLAAIFDAVSRLIERVRTDAVMLDRLVKLERGEADQDDEIRYD